MMRPHSSTRRQFLGLSATAFAAMAGLTRGDDRPAAEPRAYSGGSSETEPSWEERITVSVGSSKGDVAGTDDRAIQAAVDYVARLGGGTVRVLPGTFRLRNAIYLPSRIRLVGSGADSRLVKEPSVSTALKADADWYDQEITLSDASGFRVGDGVCLRAKNPHNSGHVVLKRTLVARSGNRFRLDRPLRENLWIAGTPTASTLFPILSGDNVSDIVIENLLLDGNRDHNENLDGNYAGCIFLQDCNRVAIRRVEAAHNNGDGISWQVCHDVTVEHCFTHGHAGLGLHPGSGSQRPTIRDNRVENNDIGIFFCWGVRQGIAERNTIRDIHSHGISIGHRDTDNLVRDNTVIRSGKVGILFRDESQSFAGHRNRIERNRIVDSGPDDGVAIDVRGETNGVVLTNNTLDESRSPARRVGIRVGPKTQNVSLENNTIQGFAVAIDRITKV